MALFLKFLFFVVVVVCCADGQQKSLSSQLSSSDDHAVFADILHKELIAAPHFQSDLRSRILKELSASPNENQSGVKDGDAEGCGVCICKAVGKISIIAAQSTEHFCEHATCPLVKHLCKLAMQHQEATVGMLLQELRAVLLGYSYCLGTRTCTAMDASSIFSEPPLGFVDKCLSGNVKLLNPATEDAIKSLAMSIPSIGSDEQEIENQISLAKTQDEEGSEENEFLGLTGDLLQYQKSGLFDISPLPADWKSCRRCIRVVSHHIMMMIVKKVDDLCEHNQHAPGTVMGDICDVVYNHSEFFYGYMLGAVEPWKFAMGYCSGIGTCACGASSHAPPPHPSQPEILPQHHHPLDVMSPLMKRFGELRRHVRAPSMAVHDELAINMEQPEFLSEDDDQHLLIGVIQLQQPEVFEVADSIRVA